MEALVESEDFISSGRSQIAKDVAELRGGRKEFLSSLFFLGFGDVSDFFFPLNPAGVGINDGTKPPKHPRVQDRGSVLVISACEELVLLSAMLRSTMLQCYNATVSEVLSCLGLRSTIVTGAERELGRSQLILARCLVLATSTLLR